MHTSKPHSTFLREASCRRLQVAQRPRTQQCVEGERLVALSSKWDIFNQTRHLKAQGPVQMSLKKDVRSGGHG